MLEVAFTYAPRDVVEHTDLGIRGVVDLVAQSRTGDRWVNIDWIDKQGELNSHWFLEIDLKPATE